MYLKKMIIKNSGPIEDLSVKMPFYDNGDPKPIVFVGENGSGKTILLSSIVDAIHEIATQFFDDILPKDGNTHEMYKIVSPSNQKVGSEYSFTFLTFDSPNGQEIEYIEKTGKLSFQECKSMTDSILSLNINWIDNGNYKETTRLKSIDTLKDDLIKNSYCFFPSKRYENPHWLNINRTRETFKTDSRFVSDLGRSIIIESDQDNNKSWLFDVIFDSKAEISNTINHDGKEEYAIHSVKEVNLYRISKMNIELILTSILGKKVILSAHNRSFVQSRIHLADENRRIILPSIDNLSFGQSILFNMFSTIIRYSDQYNPIKSITPRDITGIVIIDEIDSHLHINLQRNVLPELIKMFPKVQFILTSHSPMFLLGMDKTFGLADYQIFEMPNGNQISCERFSEFQNAYSVISETKTFEDGLNKLIEKESKPIVFVEGIYDIEYITCAAKELSEENLLDGIVLKYAGGFPNLNKIDKHFECQTLREILKQRILLLYDCDLLTANEKKHDKTMGSVFRRTIPPISSNKIKKGIENLFPNEVIDDAIRYNIAFIDHKAGRANIIEGNDVDEPEEFSINENQKRNFCDWIRTTKNNPDTFINFTKIFDIIKDFLQLTAIPPQPPTASQESHSES